jgi:hypothetical protein
LALHDVAGFSKEQVTTIWKKLGKEVAINEEVQTLRSVLSEHELITIIYTASSIHYLGSA